MDRRARRESWGSRLGFILATTGFAVGLGNIWRFPYIVGENGGGAFLLLYLVFAFLIGIPLITMELSLGRQAQSSPIAGMARLTGSRSSPWNLIGWLGVGSIGLILSYYVMLTAWIVSYTGLVAIGAPIGSDPSETGRTFAKLIARPGPQIAVSLGICISITAVLRRGLQGGLERLARIAMPVLVVVMVGLAVWSVLLPGALPGLAWLFTPDFSALNGRVALAALGQVFYSIGVGMGVAFAFGSYLPPGQSSLPASAAIVVAADTFMAVLAGLVIFPAMFSMGMAPDSGPSLLFVSMTAMFSELPGGRLFGFLFFGLMTIAALTSLIAGFELLTTVLKDTGRIGRTGAAAVVGSVAWLTSTVVILSEGPWAGLSIAGHSLFEAIDRLSGTYLLTTGGFLISLYVALGWGFDRFKKDTNQGSTVFRITSAWKPVIQWVIPVAMALILAGAVGLL